MKKPSGPKSKSHPVIQYKSVPVVKGPLSSFGGVRSNIIRDVVQKTEGEFLDKPINLILSEALYQERLRLRRINKIHPMNFFNLPRTFRDQNLWQGVQSGLKRATVNTAQKDLLHDVLNHYSNEIAGRFNPAVYHLATRAVPWTFSWLLNAASVQRFLPWGGTQALQDRLSILGEVPTLQKLAKKGTILLVPNHQSNIDSVLIGYVIYLMQLPPFSYGAGLNLYTNPMLGFFMSRLGAYTVDRKKRNVLYKSALKNYSTRILKEGVHSIFFPGGGRSRSGAIESHLKLGLMGTALDAQIENLQMGKKNPNIYIVPMVTSFHFVLEAASLIEDYLESIGKHRYMGANTQETLPLVSTMKFFWRLFSSQSGVTVRIGRPMDVFGNAVDDEGHSLGPNGTQIDPQRWLTTAGKLKSEPQRDREYTRRLGDRLVDAYYKENTVLSSHLVAFSYFVALRKKYPDLDLFRFLRLSHSQRCIPYDEFMTEAETMHGRLGEAADRGELFLSDFLKSSETRSWVAEGVSNLGLLHDHSVIKIQDGVVWTEDMNLLYFYRNRLSGYGLSLYGEKGRAKKLRGEQDEQGFLA